MAEKISTLILKVDLDCRKCYKKIRKILCKLQDEERIRTISYDDVSKMIAVAGTFDPHKLSCRIRCMGGKVIKGIDIMHDGGGGCKPAKMAGAPPMNNGKKKQKEKPKVMEPPPAEPEQPPPAAAKPVWPVDVTPATVEIPSCPAQPVPAAGPAGPCGCLCCPPCSRGYYEGCRCCSCGRVYGYAVGVLPPTAECYCGRYRPCCSQLLSEEDPASACTIM